VSSNGIYIRHSSSFRHDTGLHPECSDRINAIEDRLAEHSWLGLSVVDAPEATKQQLLRAHSLEHIERVKAVSEQGGGAVDPDTVLSRYSYQAALHAAGGAVRLVDALIGREAQTGFVGLRPPGHHAERNQAMGFCLFSNVAVAALHALESSQVQRVAVIDWDVHHGNGTQHILEDRSDALFISIHQSPLYPGTGASSETGTGAGTGYTVNLPVPAGSGDSEWCSLVDHLISPICKEFEPQLILVSAGYDAHIEEQLANCCVTDSGYYRMALTLWQLATQLGVPLGFVLEGGYALSALSRSVFSTLKATQREPELLQPIPKDVLTQKYLKAGKARWPDLVS